MPNGLKTEAEEAAQALFLYLKDIIYNPSRADINTDALPEEFRKLAQGLQFLAKSLKEEQDFGRALSRGDLSAEAPDIENVFAGSWKELQGSLRHLAWQTDQVAKGDYSQRVDFMGDFSTAFNTMTQQLKERQDALTAEKENLDRKNTELSNSLDLVLALTERTHLMIVVFSEETGEVVFRNQATEWFLKTKPELSLKLRDKLQDAQSELKKGSTTWCIRLEGDEDAYYEVESFPITWVDQSAIAHLVTDDTERKSKEDLMYSLAYRDPLTGLNNRRYVWDMMEDLYAQGKPFSVAVIDLDHLKYCNDTFGHKVGDQYLQELANALVTTGGVVARVGGDEFYVVHETMGSDELEAKLATLHELFQESSAGSCHPKSFSFAVRGVPERALKSLDEYLREADEEMYQYKQRHRKPIEDTRYIDDRIR